MNQHYGAVSALMIISIISLSNISYTHLIAFFSAHPSLNPTYNRNITIPSLDLAAIHNRAPTSHLIPIPGSRQFHINRITKITHLPSTSRSGLKIHIIKSHNHHNSISGFTSITIQHRSYHQHQITIPSLDCDFAAMAASPIFPPITIVMRPGRDHSPTSHLDSIPDHENRASSIIIRL